MAVGTSCAPTSSAAIMTIHASPLTVHALTLAHMAAVGIPTAAAHRRFLRTRCGARHRLSPLRPSSTRVERDANFRTRHVSGNKGSPGKGRSGVRYYRVRKETRFKRTPILASKRTPPEKNPPGMVTHQLHLKPAPLRRPEGTRCIEVAKSSHPA